MYNDLYKIKYLKYKTKYLELKGGTMALQDRETSERRIKRENNTIKFLTYNILVATPFMENGVINSGEFRHWNNRKDNIKKVISKYDIGVLVESIESKLSYILPYNFDYIFGNKIGLEDGTTIFFNKDKFIFKEKLVKKIKHGDTQVLVVGIFEQKKSNKLFAVAGLHLKSGYGNFEHKRQAQMINALFDIKDFIKKYNNIPVILAGDLNSDTYKNDKYPNLSLNAPLKPHFDYKRIPLIKNQITYHYHHKSIFDYIFVKGEIGFTTSKTGVTATTSTIAPNASQGSDHFPLSAELELL